MKNFRNKKNRITGPLVTFNILTSAIFEFRSIGRSKFRLPPKKFFRQNCFDAPKK